MGSELVPGFMLDQGMYYPPAADYYGYYCTGNESPGEWDDHRFFGLDGRDIQYSGLQTEGSPYIYYMPSYEYAQSPFNPYNPYIPGAVEFDGTLVGAQPYFTNPSFQQVTSTPAYLPFVVHSTSEVVPLPYSTSDPSHFSTISSVPGNHDGAVATFTPSLPSATRVPTTQKVSSGNIYVESPKPFSNQIKDISNKSEESKVNGELKKHSTLNGVFLPGVLSPSTQVRNPCDPVQSVPHITNGNFHSFQNPLKSNFATKTGFTNFEHNIPSSAIVDKLGTKFQNLSHRVLEDGDRSSNLYTWQNRGPRTMEAKSQGAFASISQDNSVLVYANGYNKDDLLVDYPNAKFFVIKSYSEDDVHKSIKYSVWSSTINGNKKLNAAFEDSQRISSGEQEKCPIFLFFSVNGSGHFCGVAEMLGPVNFQKDMDFWQQNKWTGSFPVKWHIIKDIPNTNLRHILLENNENRPVTHSRDTQELLSAPGRNMLKVFKESPLWKSILDDFLYYEEKEKLMQQERAKTLQKNYGSPLSVPIFVPLSTSISTKEPVPSDQSPNDIANHRSKSDELRPIAVVLSKDQNGQHDCVSQTVAVPIKGEKYSTIHHPQVENPTKSDENQIPSLACETSNFDKIVCVQPPENDDMQLQTTVPEPTKTDQCQPNGEADNSQKKAGDCVNSPLILARESDGSNTLGTDVKSGQLTINGVVTVGSVQIKLINAQENPGILTERKIPMDFRVTAKMSR